ncbi:NAD(P)/FAD-dependent oxidoreductase [Flavobacterium luteum]|uniref:FAD-binding oxidoreductase n=1 Tax=Flavobacterium luteum TaxID=2026654 RepID=A0A7J5AGA5_9FLAO|nr:FAD-dependent oxidoreductase [Flavobacterium luteum]KAB1156657.1 FAD-binding oxidoreductase [Flavobacterium luteum]
MIDYLIIGSGLAGIAFAETALNNNKSVLVIDNDSNSSSKVAGGLYNPVILKRFTPISNAQEQLNELTSFYTKLESKLGIQVDFKIPILRKFFSIEEQNNWFVASDKINLVPFLSTILVTKIICGLDSPFDFGEVKQTGYVNVPLLLENYKSYLINNNLFLNESFDYTILKSNPDGIEYKTILARHVVFAEGFGMHSNPYFNHLPLDGTKGELLIIKAPKLDLDVIVNTSVFILPLGNGLFKIGATYNWQDKTNIPTAEGKQELIDRIKEILNCDFEIVSHFAGVRPTVKDRKPLIGTHHIFKNIHILNGLGTRGVMLGPFLAKLLFESIESGVSLPNDINIERYEKKK